MLKIHSFETFWTHEGPWIRFVIFTQWCKFRCLYCHNPDTQSVDWGKMYTVDELIHMTERVKPYFGNRGGVTISWWEPLLQAKAIIPLFKRLGELWIHRTIDTNGHPWNSDVEELIKNHTDLVLLDIKQMNPQKHQSLTYQSNENTLKFADWLESIGKPVWLRYVLVPGYTDNAQDLELFWKKFESDKNIESVDILPYHKLWVYKYNELWIPYHLDGISSPTSDEILKAKHILEQYFKRVIVR